jgi:hypothetical protein
MSPAFRRFVFAIFSAVCAIFLSSNANADGIPKKKHAHHTKHVTKAAAKHKKHAAKAKKRVAAAKPQMRLGMPPPGHEGQERDDWFMRRRAWPNEMIDPNAYPTMLAQAARMPVYGEGARNSKLSTMKWQCIGPYSIDGRVTCIATHPTDSNTFYVGAATGGLWKTTDHGTTWRCVTDTFGSLPTGTVAIDPVNPQTLYLGMGEPNGSGDSYPGNGLWKTTNGGDSWTYLGFAKAQYLGKIVFDPHDHNTLYMAVPGPNTLSDSNRGVWKTTDAGANWTRALFVRNGKSKSSTPIGFIDVAVNPLNSAQIVAFAWDHTTPFGSNFSSGSAGAFSGVYRSSDSGTSWVRSDTLSNSGLPNAGSMKVLGRGALLWTVKELEISSSDYLYALYTRVDTNPVTHYATDENFQGLYRSTDQGLTWSKVLDSTAKIPMGGVQGKDSANIMNAQGGYNLYMAASRVPLGIGAPRIYIGGIDVLESSDLGDSWHNITNSYSEYYAKGDRRQHSDQHGLAFTAGHNDMLVVSDGGVFHTDDFGVSWEQLKGLPITQFYSIEPWRAGMANTPATITAKDLKVFGGTQDNGTISLGLSSDTNFVWINGGDGTNAYSHPTDSNKILTSLQLGVIFARNSLDSLTTVRPVSARDTTHDTRPRWHTLTNRLLKGAHAITDTAESTAWAVPVVLDDNDPNQLYTARCHVYHAVLDWNDLENIKWYPWSPVIGGNLSNDSAWYYGDIETIAIGPRVNGRAPMLWAGGYNSSGAALYRTLVDPNRADTVAPTWVLKKTGLPSANVSAIVPDRSDSLTAFVASSYAGSGSHVLRTTDGGTHWVSISGNLPSAPVSALIIDTLAEHGDPLLKNQILLVGTDVGVFVTTNGGTKWYALGSGLPHIIVSDMKMYKNMLIAATHGRSIYALDISNIQAAIDADVTQQPSVPSVRAYPNPARTSFNVSGMSEHITSCRFVDIASGKQFERTVNDAFSISTNGIPSGAYAVELLQNGTVVARTQVTIVK